MLEAKDKANTRLRLRLSYIYSEFQDQGGVLWQTLEERDKRHKLILVLVIFIHLFLYLQPCRHWM